tara:strand:+ start:100 stop:309 length:210 start_codon:yes stop_codon:yes gene_type:complete
MGNMSYCRFENTASDLRDCVNAIRSGKYDELNNYEIEGLKEILYLAELIMDDHDFIKEIIEDYEEENYE